ncbi:hypothetical protein GQR58_023572 [Nymphon striatum]|nr:hypothetical protein GQR58_023572 [Nymphon striatum]
MSINTVISKDIIRANFAAAMSEMYQQEVPEYERLLSLSQKSNEKYLKQHSIRLSDQEKSLLAKEHHGAIRVGTENELSTLRRVFNVMGMFPVDYYDLSVAGIPVHSTAFRATNPEQLLVSPFRVFTSLLRLDLISDESLREEAASILSTRTFFTDRLLSLLDKSEQNNGLNEDEAATFVAEALEIFLLDIDDIQTAFTAQGFKAKSFIEGPPKRDCDILLRQTSFIALDEKVFFLDGETGTHTARFGEVEQRGVALTPKGRKLYDELLNIARENKTESEDYLVTLSNAFASFPDSYSELREQKLAYFNYFDTDKPLSQDDRSESLEGLIESGYIDFKPIKYEDFLPVSAAGIFTSNLATDVAPSKEFKLSP